MRGYLVAKCAYIQVHSCGQYLVYPMVADHISDLLLSTHKYTQATTKEYLQLYMCSTIPEEYLHENSCDMYTTIDIPTLLYSCMYTPTSTQARPGHPVSHLNSVCAGQLLRHLKMGGQSSCTILPLLLELLLLATVQGDHQDRENHEQQSKL